MTIANNQIVPDFRRGFQPPPGSKKLYYKGISLPTANRAWLSVVKWCQDHRSEKNVVKKSDTIRESMGRVSKQSATLYRRVWDSLGLVVDIPGEWNDERYERPDFDHGTLNKDYASYSDWSEWQMPAVMEVLDLDPHAFSARVDGYEVYVLNRGLTSLIEEDIEAVACGDSFDRSSVWFVSPDGPTYKKKTLVVHSRETIPTLGADGVDNRKGELSSPTVVWEQSPPPPATTLLVSDTNRSRGRLKHRRRRSASCLLRTERRPLRVPEIVKLSGIPRASLYRMIDRGQLVKVSRGLYWCVCHDPETLESIEVPDDLSAIDTWAEKSVGLGRDERASR